MRTEELQRRLAEAEATLEAIRNGSVDALVVAAPQGGTRIYTLEGADRPYRRLIEQMHQGAATLGPDGTIAYCNPRLAELIGYSAAQLNGTTLASHVAPADRAWLYVLLREGRNGTAQGETHLERADGVPVPVYLTVSALQEDPNAPLCLLVTDLTDAKFEDLYEFAPDMMCSVDVSSGKVLQCNLTLSRELGYAKSEILGRPVLDLYAPQCRAQAERVFKTFLEQGQVRDDELQLRSKDGGILDVSLSISAVRDGQGRIVRSRQVLRDITDRKVAEAALRDADRRKDEFLAILAHELRNPLAPIRSAVEVLRIKQNQDEHVRWSGEVIGRQLEQLTRLVDDLLDVSRITRDKIELRRVPVPLATVLQRAVEACQPLIDSRRHTLELALPDEPLWLDADAARITQVLGNLLNNAAKYTPDGGRIRIEAGHREGQVYVRVRDNGIGIPPALRPHLFDMFVQGEAARDRSQGGLGIGLTLVRSLVQMHGGSIEVESEGAGRGSQFTVRLPLGSSPARRAGDAHPRAQLPALNRRVLVVDDNRDAADALAALLGLLGLEVRAAFSGAEACELAAAFKPDVVLMDLGMPDMNGYEAARRILAQPGNENAQLIALTGWGQASDRDRTEAAGFAHHLTKPVDVERLQNLLASLSMSAGAATH